MSSSHNHIKVMAANVGDSEEQVVQSTIPYDESLLERSLTQWQFGDWQSLSQLNHEILQHHPDRAKLALLSAAGRFQIGQLTEARQFIGFAKDWGVSDNCIRRILIAGAYNSLGRAASICEQSHRALKHFEHAISIGSPGSDVKLLAMARTREQLSQIGFVQAGEYIKINVNESLSALPIAHVPPLRQARPLADIHHAWQVGCWSFLADLDNADLVTYTNRAELALYAACGYQQMGQMEGLERCSRLAREWGCPGSKLKKYLAAGIHNTFAISETLSGNFEHAARSFIAALSADELTNPTKQLIMSRVQSQLKQLKKVNIESTFEAISKHLNEILM